MRNPWDPLVDETGRPGLTLGEWAIVGAGGAVLFLLASLAWAQPTTWTGAACTYFARFALSTANVRDAGAQVDKHLKVLRRTTRADQVDLLPIFERELVRVHAEGLAPEKAEASAYTRCMTGEILGKDS